MKNPIVKSTFTESIEDVVAAGGYEYEQATTTHKHAAAIFERMKRRFQEVGIADLLTPENRSKTRILDIGCRDGLQVDFLRSIGFKAYGIDAFPLKNGHHIKKGRIEKMPFSDKSFDIVMSNHAFDKDLYTQHQRSMTQDIQRVLKLGGIHFRVEPKAPYVEVIGKRLRWNEGDYDEIYQRTF